MNDKLIPSPRPGTLGNSMPLPGGASILDLALWHPRAALGIIMGIPRVPITMNAVVSITSPATNATPLQGSLDTTITQETWFQDVEYSIIQPNSFAGNVLKSQSDYFFKFCSGINVQLQIESGPRYITTINPTPIENIAGLLGKNWPSGWPLFCNQSLRVFFTLTQPPPSVPLQVTMSFMGWQFLDKCLDQVADETARCKLRELGIYSPSLEPFFQGG